MARAHLAARALPSYFCPCTMSTPYGAQRVAVDADLLRLDRLRLRRVAEAEPPLPTT